MLLSNKKNSVQVRHGIWPLTLNTDQIKRRSQKGKTRAKVIQPWIIAAPSPIPRCRKSVSARGIHIGAKFTILGAKIEGTAFYMLSEPEIMSQN